jgi:uncharacterized protein YaaQ
MIPFHRKRTANLTGMKRPGVEKLAVIITSDDYADGLVRDLISRNLPATRISSTGGFLRRGNATILVGIDEDEITHLHTVVKLNCPVRTEMISADMLPFPDLTFLQMEPPIEVRVGGAVIFILPVEQFIKT